MICQIVSGFTNLLFYPKHQTSIIGVISVWHGARPPWLLFDPKPGVNVCGWLCVPLCQSCDGLLNLSSIYSASASDSWDGLRLLLKPFTECLVNRWLARWECSPLEIFTLVLENPRLTGGTNCIYIVPILHWLASGKQRCALLWHLWTSGQLKYLQHVCSLW